MSQYRFDLLRPGHPDAVRILYDAANARENLILQSEDITTTWTDNAAVDSVTNSTVAPNGTTTADTIADDGATGNSALLSSQTVTVATATQYVISCWFKAKGLSTAYFELDTFTTPADNTRCFFDLAAGTVLSQSVNLDGSGIAKSRNGWYRCWASFTTDAADTSGVWRHGPSDGTTVSQPRDGTSSVYCWGHQMELGSEPTSYIPTTTVAVTSSTITATGNFQDDIHAALELLTGKTGALPDLYKYWKEAVGI